jgi:hypothetical protein
MKRMRTKTITVRGVPHDVTRVIRRRAEETGESVNRVVIKLLDEGAGVREKGKTLLHHDLDGLIGVWSREEARSFDRALEDQRK